jgi:stage II sporulation protein P
LRWQFVRLVRPPGRSGTVWRSPFIRSIVLTTLGFCLVAFGVSWVPRLAPPQAVPVFAFAEDGTPTGKGWIGAVLQQYPIDFPAILKQGLPQITFFEEAGEEEVWLQRVDLLARGTGSLRSLRLPLGGGPLDFLASELALLTPPGSAAADERRGAVEVLQESPPPAPEQAGKEPPEPAQPVQAPTGPPLVAIYHTHTSEDYVPTSGATHMYDKKAGIVVVGEALTRALVEEHGIRTVHDKTAHDKEVYREAYLRSAVTAARLCQENPSLKVLLDIHRDAPSRNRAESRSMTTTEINGEKAARLYLIVGTDRLGLEHPNWQKNHAFALKLQQILDALYPGLSRGIKIDTARFNQHLHPRALLVEVGGDQNTLEEAELATKYLAEALAALIPELE